MLNRRHIRIKVMQLLYANKGNENTDIVKNQKLLNFSIQHLYNLYLTSLALLIELHKKSEDYNEKLKHTLSTTTNQNISKLQNNQLLQILSNNQLLNNRIAKSKLNTWELDFEYVDMLFKAIIKSDLHKKYNHNTATFADQKQFITTIFSQIIAPNDKLFDLFEDKNLTWVDDIPVVNTLILKLLKRVKPTSPETLWLPKLVKDNTDLDFANDLLKKTILNNAKLTKAIMSKTKNWDIDRLATIDKVILKMAICEFQNFPSIPHKVTINEYLEIAKEYSTPKSSIFINGILDKVVKEYLANKLYPKVGRGLL